MATIIWIVNFRATNSAGEQREAGPFSFTKEPAAHSFVDNVVADEMRARIDALDEWQQQEVMRERKDGTPPTLEDMVKRYYGVVDEEGKSSLTWSVEMNILNAANVGEARSLFEFV